MSKQGENSAEGNSKERSEKYLPPFFLFGSHVETIYPALLRRVTLLPYARERIVTPDDDFLDLDWLEKKDSDRVVIISHGLEGNSTRPYIKGMAKALHANGFNVVAWNLRGCSGEMNRQLRFYHSGATDDLATVIRHVSENKKFKNISLVGFSLGGNITLKYLGEGSVPDAVRKAVVFSVPLDLKSSCEKISRPFNRLYSNRFLRSLKSKIILKAQSRPELDTTGLRQHQNPHRIRRPVHGAPSRIQGCGRLLRTVQFSSLCAQRQNTQPDYQYFKRSLPGRGVFSRHFAQGPSLCTTAGSFPWGPRRFRPIQ